MSASNEATEPDAKPRVFKSKKELVILAVSAAIFAVVIYKMYLSKGDRAAGVAELDDAAIETAALDVPPASVSPQDVIAGMQFDDTDDAGPASAPLKLARNPFKMSQTMREQIYNIHQTERPAAPSSEPVTLTDENFRAVLGQIPGAEQAAFKGFRIGAVMISADWRGAVINDRVLAVGDTLLGFTLVEVLDDSVVLERGAHRVRLHVRPPQKSDKGGPGPPGHLWKGKK